MIQYTIYDTVTMLNILRYLPPKSDYWLNLCFGREVQFTTEYIEFSKLARKRNLAPLVTPLSQGKPVFSETEAVKIGRAHV